MTNCTIPQGYKATPLGIIPQEWEVRRLGDLCCNQGDYGINAPAVAYSNDLPTYLRITDISDDGKFIIDNKASVNSPNSESYHLKEGDIVFARTGATVGKTYLYDPADGDLVFAGFLIRFSPNEQKIVPYYLKTYTNTAAYWYWVKIISQRSGQPGINAAEYSSLQLPVPPLAEQKKIAEVLGVWDKAIEKQSQLIEQLTLRKRGLMQQLLTAKRRLPGFSDPWEEVRLGEIAQCFSGGTPKAGSNKYYDGNIPFIRSGEIHQKDTELFLSEMGIEESSAKMVQKGDLLMALYGANSGDSAVSQIDGAINQAILCIRPRNVLVSFLCPFLNLNKDMYIAKYLQGGQGNLSREIVLSYKISVPPFAEQIAIAEVLTAADREIELAQQKLELLRQQKRGLMQQLLTGKKRVKY